jgi:AcrR family transcriptional regulator
MRATPWGLAEELRTRKLRPGPSESRENVARNQRERLMGAMVAAVSERGYETTRVADVLKIAGVSRSAYYQYFANKQECFLATLDELLALAEPVVREAYRNADGPWDVRLRAAFDVVIEMIVAQPDAARVWFVESYSAGPEAIERIERLGDRLERLTTKAIAASRDRTGVPSGLVRAVLGGLRQVINNRLRRGREAELFELAPDLLDWALGYQTPSEPLRRPRKAPALPEATADPSEQRARIVRAVTEAVAEKGYSSMTITEIAKRAAVSLSTFYALFDSKADAFLAAIEDGERRLIETVVPVYEQATDWPHAVKDSIHAVFAFLAADTAAAKLGGMDIYAGGPAAVARQENARESFRVLLRRGFEDYPSTPEVAAEAIGCSIAELIFQQLRNGRAERIYEASPTATYLALAPYMDDKRATAIANEAWRPAA